LTRLWKQARFFVVHRILHADDTPHRIALGAGVAVFVAMTPMLGLHTVLAVSLAVLLRANKAVCLPIVWITNPATAVPIYWFCWRVGTWLLHGREPAQAIHIQHRLTEAVSLNGGARLLEWSFWTGLFRVLATLGAELWLGCFVVGFLTAVASYGLTRWGVSAYRGRRAARMMRRHAFIRSTTSPPAAKAGSLPCRDAV